MRAPYMLAALLLVSTAWSAAAINLSAGQRCVSDITSFHEAAAH